MNKFWLLVTALLSGCAGIYQQPSTSQPHAVLVTEFAENELIQGGAQLFYAYDNDNCQANQGTAMTALKDTERTRTTRIPSDKKIYIQATTIGNIDEVHACSTGFCVPTAKCTNLISFTPQQSETYTIKHNYKNNTCLISLTYSKTNKSPKSMRPHPIKSGCEI